MVTNRLTVGRWRSPSRSSTLGTTLFSWRDEIGQMWRFSKTNGITEGLHNKMEMIHRTKKLH
jgi:transposase